MNLLATIRAAADSPPTAPRPVRLLAVDPVTRGFGYAVFDNVNLLDWGMVRVESPGRNDKCIDRFVALIMHFSPDHIVLEDLSGSASRRSARVKELIEALHAAAKAHRIKVGVMKWLTVRRYWTDLMRPTKLDVAREIVRHFPELRHQLPDKRRVWDSQDPHLSIFNAAAIAVAFIFLRLAPESDKSD